MLSPSRFRPADPTRQCGSAALGFLLGAIPVLLLGLGGVELSNWLWVRQALSHALLEAGRAAAVDHGRPGTLIAEFERALAPLYLKPGSLQRALAQRNHDTGQAPWRIRILAPARAAFQDHASGIPGFPDAPAGLRVINHDYQALQHRQRLAQGWPEGRGPASGQTIFEANTLDIELVWAHKPLIPGIRALLRTLGPGMPDYRGQIAAQGYLPMLRRITLTMQSHPMDWPDSTDGKVVHGAVAQMSSYGVVDCSGFWGDCRPRGNVRSAPPPSGPPSDEMTPSDPGQAQGGPVNGLANGLKDESSAAGDGAGSAPGVDDAPACGVHLCC